MKKKLVSMEKDGETIEVSPLVVENHKQLGWKVVGEPAEEAAPAEGEKQVEGKSRRSRSRKSKVAAEKTAPEEE
jgi:hypothetical protein